MKNEWRKKHWKELKTLAGKWIAYEPDGDIIGSDKSLLRLRDKIKNYTQSYTFYYGNL